MWKRETGWSLFQFLVRVQKSCVLVVTLLGNAVTQLSSCPVHAHLSNSITSPLLYYRGLGIKRRLIDISKKYLLFFSKMFENVQLFSHWHSKFAKGVIMSIYFFLKNIHMGIKKAEFLLISNSLMPT